MVTLGVNFGDGFGVAVLNKKLTGVEVACVFELFWVNFLKFFGVAVGFVGGLIAEFADFAEGFPGVFGFVFVFEFEFAFEFVVDVDSVELFVTFV